MLSSCEPLSTKAIKRMSKRESCLVGQSWMDLSSSSEMGDSVATADNDWDSTEKGKMVHENLPFPAAFREDDDQNRDDITEAFVVIHIHPIPDSDYDTLWIQLKYPGAGGVWPTLGPVNVPHGKTEIEFRHRLRSPRY